MSKQAASWRKKRAEMIALRGNACTNCGDADCRLNVHHRYYEAGKKKWDYPNETLDVLCPRCHGYADELRREIARVAGYLDMKDTERAIGYVRALVMRASLPNPRPLKLNTHAVAAGAADLIPAIPPEELYWLSGDRDLVSIDQIRTAIVSRQLGTDE